MGGSARYRLAKKIREGKALPDEVTSYFAFEDENGEVKIYGFYGYEDNPNSGWVEVDSNGRPTKLLRKTGNEDIPEKGLTYIDIDSEDFKEIKEKIEKRQNPDEDYDDDNVTMVPYGDTYVEYR